MQENNKKTLILSVLGVLVLIIAVVGVSFAMYSFSAAGTRENVIKTGTASISFDSEGKCEGLAEGETATDYKDCEEKGGTWTSPNTIKLTSEYPKTVAKGLENNAVAFEVTTDYPGDMIVDYALQFVDVKAGAHNLTEDMIMLQVKKTVGETVTYPMGAADNGAKFSSVKDKTNALTGATTGYVFDSGSFTAKGTVSYELKAWVSDAYDLYYGNPEYAGTCSIAGNDTATACQTAGGTWTQTKATEAETFTFKIRVIAAQRTGA